MTQQISTLTIHFQFMGRAIFISCTADIRANKAVRTQVPLSLNAIFICEATIQLFFVCELGEVDFETLFSIYFCKWVYAPPFLKLVL